MTDDDMWADLEAAPLNIWLGDPTAGLWCPICNLPSGWKVPMSSDPHDPEPGWMYGCGEDGKRHGNAVRDAAA